MFGRPVKKEKTEEKVFKEIDKKIIELEKNISDYSSLLIYPKKNEGGITKKLQVIAKDVDQLYKIIYEPKTFNLEICEYFLEKNIVKLLSDYCTFREVKLIRIILPVIEKILFNSQQMYQKIDMCEEILLMNTSIVTSIKTLILTFLTLIVEKFDDVLYDQLISFLYILVHKIIIYPNFYFAVSSTYNDNDTFDLAIFEIIIELFSKEGLLKSKEAKLKLRKTFLFTMNLENFNKIGVNYLQHLLEYLIENLIRYYDNYKLYNCAGVAGKKDKSYSDSVEEVYRDDLIAFFKFLNTLYHTQLKSYISNLLFNNFFIEYVQKDILNMSSYGESEYDVKLVKVFEILYLFAKYIYNKEINDVVFYFIFGFNSYEDNILDSASEKDSYSPKTFLDEIEEEEFDNSPIKVLKNRLQTIETESHNNNKTVILDINGDNLESMKQVKLKLDNFIKFNFQGKLNINVKINKNQHKFEGILSFIISTLESNAKNKILLKAYFLNFLANIIRNSPKLFLVEIIIPYYTSQIFNAAPKDFKVNLDKLKSKRSSIDLYEIIKSMNPYYFNINNEDWENYFNLNLKENFHRITAAMDNFDITGDDCNYFETSVINEPLDGKPEINTTRTNISIYSNASICLDMIDMNEDDENNISHNNRNTTVQHIKKISHATTNFCSSEWNKTCVNLLTEDSNLYPDEFNDFSNQILNVRVNFYESLLKYFKSYILNSYIENLYLTKVFSEIFALPSIVNAGKNCKEINNIYFNVTFAVQKKLIYFNISSVGILQSISNKIDELVRLNFSREEINKNIINRIKNENKVDKNEKGLINGVFSNVNQYKAKDKKMEIIDNAVLFSEFFKDYTSNILTRFYLDRTNYYNIIHNNKN
jgi:hypothetical protein